MMMAVIRFQKRKKLLKKLEKIMEKNLLVVMKRLSVTKENLSKKAKEKFIVVMEI